MDAETESLYHNLSICLMSPQVIDYKSAYACFYDFDFYDVNDTTIKEVLQRKFLIQESNLEKLENRPFVPSLNLQVFWWIMFGLLVILAILGNLGVISIVIRHREMKSTTNMFLVNLSMTDLLMATFNAIFNFAYMLTSNWPFGQIYCVINNFISTLTVSASVLTITVTCFDRYYAIKHPLTHRMTKRKAIRILIMIWFIASLLSLPSLILSTTHNYQYRDGQQRILCLMKWPDGVSGKSTYDYFYNIILFFLTYLFPMTTMGITYSIIGRILWSSEGLGEMTSVQRDSVRKKQKAVPMLITVTVIFAFCWLPYHLYFLVTYHVTEITKISYVQHIYLLFYWIAMSNSALNPLIYALLNQKFRRFFKQDICCGNLHNKPDSRRCHGSTRMNQFTERTSGKTLSAFEESVDI